MSQSRSVLLIAWLVVAFLLWEAWQQDYAQPAALETPAADRAVSSPTTAVPSEGDIPDGTALPTLPADAAMATLHAGAASPVGVVTDLFRVEIDPYGGTVQRVELLNYRTEAEKDAPPV